MIATRVRVMMCKAITHFKFAYRKEFGKHWNVEDFEKWDIVRHWKPLGEHKEIRSFITTVSHLALTHILNHLNIVCCCNILSSVLKRGKVPNSHFNEIS